METIYAANKTAHGIEVILSLAAETHLARNKDLIWLGHKLIAEDTYRKQTYKLLFTIKTEQ